MVQNFQTLPEIGRAGLKVGTIQKSTKSVQKHGPANEKEAGGGPLLVPSEIVGPQVHFVEACSWREDTHVWWKACDKFVLLRSRVQISPHSLHTARQPLQRKDRARPVEEAAEEEEEDRPGNSGGNSLAIPGNSEPFSAIRVFCACPKRREFGHSLPRQSEKGKQEKEPMDAQRLEQYF